MTPKDSAYQNIASKTKSNNTIATLNVRLPEELKKHGMQVLEREGVSITEIVRDVFQYMALHQKIPDLGFSNNSGHNSKQAEVDRKRALVKSWMGIIPHDVDYDAIKQERIERKLEPKALS